MYKKMWSKQTLLKHIQLNQSPGKYNLKVV